MAPEELFLGNLPRIEQLIRSTCRRHRMEDGEIEDFGSLVKLKLIENDYAVMRQFEGKSSLHSYLYIVIQRLYLDYRGHQWGRWRASAEAKRHGEAGVEFERLTRRDGESLDAAWQVMQRRYPEVTRTQVQEWYRKLPPRTPRPRVDQGVDHLQVAGSDSADEAVIESELRRKAQRAADVIRAVIARLTTEEQLVLRMRFGSGLKVVTIANSLGIEQKRLYRLLERLLEQLRAELSAAGVDDTELAELLEHGGGGIEIPFLADDGGILATVPSNHAAEEGSGPDQP